MARRSFFFITFTICNILVRGNISPTSDSTLPPIPVLPECQTLLDSLSPSIQNLPLAVVSNFLLDSSTFNTIYATELAADLQN